MTDYDRLKNIIDEIDDLLYHHARASAPAFEAWHTKTERFLIRMFGETSFEHKKFSAIQFEPQVWAGNSEEEDVRIAIRWCSDGLRTCKAIFKTYLDELTEDLNFKEIAKPTPGSNSGGPMKKITDVTRQDLFDIIREGFVLASDTPFFNSETNSYEIEYDVRMPFSGRLSELDFLARIYDLENMPSDDRRFANAHGDIWQHTVNNDDWEPYWFFSDARFKLGNGCDDEYILKFICEMLHPAVRNEKGPWKEYLDKFNEILRPDGYELCPTRNVSGRNIYEAKAIDHVELPHQETPVFAAKKGLGEGSYARTFRYTDPFYNKDFVVKTAKPDLTPKELERFKREFEQMKLLRSPYIVEVYNFLPDSNEYTMELMDCTLYEYISKNNATLTLSQRKGIIGQLLRAYKYLHSQSVLHRDVSPRNALVNVYDDAVVVKISDFGLVKIVESDLTSENSELKGSLNDPALKVLGFGNYELRHELYAITLLLVFVLTGKLNWAKVKEVPIQEFMRKGTNPDMDKRFQTLDELQQGIRLCVKRLEEGD